MSKTTIRIQPNITVEDGLTGITLVSNKDIEVIHSDIYRWNDGTIQKFLAKDDLLTLCFDDLGGDYTKTLEHIGKEAVANWLMGNNNE